MHLYAHYLAGILAKRRGFRAQKRVRMCYRSEGAQQGLSRAFVLVPSLLWKVAQLPSGKRQIFST
jgi:hypothetical protein